MFFFLIPDHMRTFTALQPAPKFAFVQQRHLLSWPLRWNVHAMGIPELWEFPDLIVFKTLENPFPKSSVWESHTLVVAVTNNRPPF